MTTVAVEPQPQSEPLGLGLDVLDNAWTFDAQLLTRPSSRLAVDNTLVLIDMDRSLDTVVGDRSL